MKAKLINESLNEFLNARQVFDNISEIINDEEIFIYVDNIKKLFNFVGDGIYNIDVISEYSNQTDEYTNEVVIEFNDNPNGNISQDEWKQVEQILNEYIGEDGFESYEIVSSHNRLILFFNENLPLGY